VALPWPSALSWTLVRFIGRTDAVAWRDAIADDVGSEEQPASTSVSIRVADAAASDDLRQGPTGLGNYCADAVDARALRPR
jgi:hypothetical protein